jgi:hypothetical protein
VLLWLCEINSSLPDAYLNRRQTPAAYIGAVWTWEADTQLMNKAMTSGVDKPFEPGTRATVGLSSRGTFAYYLSRVLGLLRIGAAFGYEFVELAIDDLPVLPRAYNVRNMLPDNPDVTLAMPLWHVREWRYRQGAVCLGAYRAEQLVGVAWIAKHQFLEDEVRAAYHVAQDSVWDFGMEVLPAFRGSRAVLAVLAALAQGMREAGAVRSISRIADHNLASLRAHEKLGCKRLGRAMIIRVLGLQLTVSKLIGFPHVSVHDGARPDFRFS